MRDGQPLMKRGKASEKAMIYEFLNTKQES